MIYWILYLYSDYNAITGEESQIIKSSSVTVNQSNYNTTKKKMIKTLIANKKKNLKNQQSADFSQANGVLESSA